jgi:hypothetical protein
MVIKRRHGALIFMIRMFSLPTLPLEEVFDPTGLEIHLQEDLRVT